MGMQIPDWLGTMFLVTTGDGWPQADESKLWELSQAWTDTSAVINQIDAILVDVVRTVRRGRLAWEGLAADAFRQAANAQIGAGDEERLRQLAGGAQDLADFIYDTAVNVQYTKMIIIGQLQLLAAQIYELISLSKLTFGASLAAIPALQKLGRLFAQTALRQLMISILSGTVLQVGLDAATQSAQLLIHTRRHWDGHITRTSTTTAVLGGVLGAALGRFATRYRTLNPAAHTIGTGAAHEYLTEGLTGAVTGQGWLNNPFAATAGAGEGVFDALGHRRFRGASQTPDADLTLPDTHRGAPGGWQDRGLDNNTPHQQTNITAPPDLRAPTLHLTPEVTPTIVPSHVAPASNAPGAVASSPQGSAGAQDERSSSLDASSAAATGMPPWIDHVLRVGDPDLVMHPSGHGMPDASKADTPIDTTVEPNTAMQARGPLRPDGHIEPDAGRPAQVRRASMTWRRVDRMQTQPMPAVTVAITPPPAETGHVEIFDMDRQGHLIPRPERPVADAVVSRVSPDQVPTPPAAVPPQSVERVTGAPSRPGGVGARAVEAGGAGTGRRRVRLGGVNDVQQDPRSQDRPRNVHLPRVGPAGGVPDQPWWTLDEEALALRRAMDEEALAQRLAAHDLVLGHVPPDGDSFWNSLIMAAEGRIRTRLGLSPSEPVTTMAVRRFVADRLRADGVTFGSLTALNADPAAVVMAPGVRPHQEFAQVAEAAAQVLKLPVTVVTPYREYHVGAGDGPQLYLARRGDTYRPMLPSSGDATSSAVPRPERSGQQDQRQATGPRVQQPTERTAQKPVVQEKPTAADGVERSAELDRVGRRGRLRKGPTIDASAMENAGDLARSSAVPSPRTLLHDALRGNGSPASIAQAEVDQRGGTPGLGRDGDVPPSGAVSEAADFGAPHSGSTQALPQAAVAPGGGGAGSVAVRSPFVVVANRLPVNEEATPEGKRWRRSPGGVVTALHPVLAQRRGTWVGWTGGVSEASEPFELDGIRLHPVPLSTTDVELYYKGQSNATIWPLYHAGVKASVFRGRWRESYRAVNARFAEAAAEVAAEGATVWVHDYQLQLVPAMLRRLRPDLRIGFFLHIPFPPIELFMQMPLREEVLRGLLGADLVGFQQRRDAQNFIRLAGEMLKLSTDEHTIQVDDRRVKVEAFPISIDVAAMEELAADPGVRARAQEIRASLGHPKTVMLGVDRLDYTKGIDLRLKAFRELLAEGEFTNPGVVMVQVATPSREGVEHYDELRVKVEREVGLINGEFGKAGVPAVHYLHQMQDRRELAALYCAADVMLVTPLRDGMNLVAKEYVAVRADTGGTLVLSEFAGAATELQEAFLCNPYDLEGVKDALLRAVAVDGVEARRRMRIMQDHLRTHDVKQWAQSFLTELDAPKAAPEGSEDHDVWHDALSSELSSPQQWSTQSDGSEDHDVWHDALSHDDGFDEWTPGTNEKRLDNQGGGTLSHSEQRSGCRM